MLHHFIERHLTVTTTEREREARARAGERLEPQGFQHPGRTGVPGVGDHERLTRMQCSEGLSLFPLTPHSATSSTTEV